MVSNIAPLPPDEEGTSLSRLRKIEMPSDLRQMA